MCLYISWCIFGKDLGAFSYSSCSIKASSFRSYIRILQILTTAIGLDAFISTTPDWLNDLRQRHVAFIMHGPGLSARFLRPADG